MNHQNFENDATPYPLSKNRMAELQNDIQVPLKMLATALPLGNCIIAGCEGAGKPGFVCLGCSDGNGGVVYEVYEVRAGVEALYLNPREETITAKNNKNENVVVRVERYLEWSTSLNADGCVFGSLPRLWLSKAAQDDEGWAACANGTNWNAGTSGTSLRVKMEGGLVHLWGTLTYQPYIIITEALKQTDYLSRIGNTDAAVGSKIRVSLDKALYKDVNIANEIAVSRIERYVTRNLTLPTGYRPQSDVLIPIRYNGVPSTAIVDGDGNVLLAQEPEIGDTLAIDTHIAI